MVSLPLFTQFMHHDLDILNKPVSFHNHNDLNLFSGRHLNITSFCLFYSCLRSLHF